MIRKQAGAIQKIFALAAVLSAPALSAAPPQPSVQVESWCAAMVQSKGKAKLEDGLNVSSLLLEQKSMMTALDSQKALIQSRYGEPRSCETISVENIGTQFEERRILLHHEKYASTWEFSFYNGTNGWELTNFWFRDLILKKESRSGE